MRASALVVALAGSSAALSSAGPTRHVEEPGLRTSVAAFLVRGQYLTPLRRVVPHTLAVAQAAVSALLRGPTAAERKEGYFSAVPAGTLLRSISVARGVAAVDLNRRFEFSTRFHVQPSGAGLMIVAYADSAKNSARIDVVRVPVTVVSRP